jgi:hypothetical protein
MNHDEIIVNTTDTISEDEDEADKKKAPEKPAQSLP